MRKLGVLAVIKVAALLAGTALSSGSVSAQSIINCNIVVPGTVEAALCKPTATLPTDFVTASNDRDGNGSANRPRRTPVTEVTPVAVVTPEPEVTPVAVVTPKPEVTPEPEVTPVPPVADETEEKPLTKEEIKEAKKAAKEDAKVENGKPDDKGPSAEKPNNGADKNDGSTNSGGERNDTAGSPGKSGDTPAGDDASKPDNTPGDKPDSKPADKPDNKPDNKPADKPGNKPEKAIAL